MPSNQRYNDVNKPTADRAIAALDRFAKRIGSPQPSHQEKTPHDQDAQHPDQPKPSAKPSEQSAPSALNPLIAGLAGFALGALLNVGPNFSSRSSASTSDIGAAIRTRRKDLGLSQEALAEKAGVGPRFVLELEKGKDTAEIGKILLVLDALNLELRVTPRG